MIALEMRAQVLQAAARLVSEGLIARTWGNISIRVSDKQFLITPSGLAYETLREDQLVLVNIADCSYEGEIKPSSEKGIHAAAYRLRPDVNFVIHTHQYWASVAGVPGRALTGFNHPLLGKRVPCAAYGLPGTDKLRKAVEAEITAWPDCRAFLMHRHGALCLGRDMEDAFAAARALEEVSERKVRDLLEERAASLPDWGTSARQGDDFLLRWNGEDRRYPIEGSALPPIAALHAAVYQAGNFQYIAHEGDPAVLAVSEGCRRLRPYLDDLAQIAGADVLCVPPAPDRVQKAMKGRNAVLLQGMGALCAGGSESDAEAVCALLKKGCAAKLYADEAGGCRPLSEVDARLQRLVYRKSYERKKEQC
ncbi:MAG: class II aldolase/adducin family protein [Oscillibacter sp.]|nr:class II aldolase/adducin family protein [Oscillibacter sp.]